MMAIQKKRWALMLSIVGLGMHGLGCNEQDHSPTQTPRPAKSSAETPNPLQYATPESVGIDSLLLDQSTAHITRAIDEQAFRGAVLLVARHGKVVLHRAFGHRDGNLFQDPNKPTPPGHPSFPSLQPDPLAPMPASAIFDLESMTKPFTAALALALDADDIRFPNFSIQDPLSEHWPDSSTLPSDLHHATVRDLMRFSSGHFIDAANFLIDDPQPWTTMYQEPPVYTPGQDTIYSDLSYRLLGNLLERLGGDSLQGLWSRYFFVPMGMNDTAARPFLNLPDKHAQIAGTAFSELRGYYLRGEVQDEQDYYIEKQTLQGHHTHTGCDGLFASAWDLAQFGQMLLNQGKHVQSNGGEAIEILPKDIAISMLVSQTEDIANPHVPTKSLNDSVVYNDKGYGWEKPEAGEWPGGIQYGPLSVSKTGGAGTIMVLHPELDLIYVLLTNHGLPSYEGIVAEPETLKLQWPSFSKMLASIKGREVGESIVQSIQH